MKDHQMISLFKYSLCVICVVWDGIQVGRVGVLGFTLMKRVFMLPILRKIAYSVESAVMGRELPYKHKTHYLEQFSECK